MNFIKGIFSPKSQDPQQTAFQTSFGSSSVSSSRAEKLIDIPIIRKKVEGKEESKSTEVDVKEKIKLTLSSKYNGIKRSADPQKIPFLVSLQPKNKDSNPHRGGLDIVIVIDISGSMSGEKIKLVVETLLFMIDEMLEQDRISLIAFDDNSEILTNLTPMTAENKERMKQIVVSKIAARGSTNIKAGLVDSFDVLLNRKEVNDVSAIFFLSDGQDTCGNSLDSITTTLQTYDKLMSTKGMSYKINSFGYGNGHDEKMLGLIANFKEGNFYYIKSNQMVDECFIDCMGYLMSIFASQAEITVFMKDKTSFEKKYGPAWSADANPSKSTIKVGFIASELNKNFVAQLSIPSTIDLHSVKICSAILSFVANKHNYSIEADLELPVVDESQLGTPNSEVEKHVLRVEAVEVLEEAQEKVKQGKKKEAEQQIKDFKCLNVYGKVSQESEKQMDMLLADDILDNCKDMEENAQIMKYEQTRFDKMCYNTANSCQTKMLSKKK